MSKTLQEVSEIVGVEVKENLKSRRRSGFDFGQTEELIAAVNEMRENVDVLSGMVQESLERLKTLQLAQRKAKPDLSAFDSILSLMRGFTDKDFSDQSISAEMMAENLYNEPLWKRLLPQILLKLAPAAGLKVDGEDIVFGPPSGE